MSLGAFSRFQGYRFWLQKPADGLIDIATTLDTLGTPIWLAALPTDTLTTADTLTADITATLTDTLTTAEALSADLAITAALSDTASTSDALQAHFATTFSDTLTTGETLSFELDGTLADTLITAEALTGALAITATLADTDKTQDTITGLVSATLADTLTTADTLTGTVRMVATLSDPLTTLDTLGGAVALFGTLADTLTTADALSADLALLGVLSDTAVTGDVLFEQSQKVYVINAETGAVGEYVLTPTVRGLAELNGVLYLATDQGLYALDADDDAGTAIAWEFRSGNLNLGTNYLKRVIEVDVPLRTTGDVALLVAPAPDGQKQEWPYKLITRDRTAIRDGRIKAGKGLKSKYWQVGVKGVGQAEIDELRLYVQRLSRLR